MSKYIASGAYGCVFEPGIPCKSKSKSSKSSKTSPSKSKSSPSKSSPKSKASRVAIVSKFFLDEKEADIENNEHEQIVKKIDPKGLFTIRSFGICDIPKTDLDSDELEKCDNFKSSPKTIKEYAETNHLRQIVYEHGGFQINHIVSRVPFDTMFAAFAPILDGIATLQRHGLAHLDIKPANLVYNFKTKKMALIDFGFCRSLDVVYADESDFMYSYAYIPPEFAHEHGHDDPMDNYVKLLAMTCTRLSVKTRQILVLNMNNVVYNSIDPKKIDVYMMGATFLQIINAYSKFVTFDLRARRNRNILDLICGMIHLNVNKRFTIQEAKAAYMQCL